MTPRIITSLIAILLLTACKPDKLDVDISSVSTTPLTALRLEEHLFSVTPQNIEEKTSQGKTAFGPLFEHYLMNLLRVNGTSDSLYAASLLSFVQDKDIRGSYNMVKKVYTKEKVEAWLPQLNDCVKRFKYHFPKRRLPQKFVTAVSGWNYAFAYTDSALVVALDMYLGDTCIYYQMLQLPQYRTRAMNEHYVLPDLLRGWMISEFDNNQPVNTLLHHTIFYGKTYYAVNALLPEIHDSLLMTYSGKQMSYCQEFEKKLWGYFAEKNRLYENDMKTIQELTTDGPFTGAISKDCPPRIAMWIGLQIVRSYMDNNKDVTLEDLMNETDPQKILNKSRYRP
jgi:hypothetical protein